MHHFYHVYCDGNWQIPFSEHIDALKKSDLINNLDSLHIGLVGNLENRIKVQKFINENNLKAEICSQVNSGYEQETIDKLHDFSKENNGIVFYAHTKNASDAKPLHVRWRKSMTYFCVIKWRDCVREINNGHYLAGSHYLDNGMFLPVNIENIKTHQGIMAGNYWWTKLEHLRLLDKPHRENRFGAEDWVRHLHTLGLPNFKVFDFNPTHPAQNIFVTEW